MHPPYFLSLYPVVITLAFLAFIALILTGSFKIHAAKNISSLQNTYVSIVYRLVQAYLIFQGLFFVTLVCMQLFSFRPYYFNPKTGASFGLLDYADGYPIAVLLHLDIPESITAIETRVDSTTYHFKTMQHFAKARRFSDHVIASQNESRMPAAFGPRHAPYRRVDTFRNEIHTLSAAQRDAFVFTPPQMASAIGRFYSESSGKNFLFALFIYFRVMECMAIAWFLLKILASFRKGQWFAPRSFSHIYAIGLALMVYQLVHLLLVIICNRWVLDPITIDGRSSLPYYSGNVTIGVTLDYHLNVPLFVTGFLLVLLSQVFKRGFLLEQDQKLTI